MENPLTFEKKREELYYYNGVALSINADHFHKCTPSLIERLADEFWASLTLHSKVLAVRIDIHANSPEMDNAVIEDLLRWAKQDLRRQYRMKNIGHVWARELGKKKGLHWHLLLLLDGHKLQNATMLIEKLKGYWEELKGFGEIKPAKNCYARINRGDETSFNEAFYRSSYLAKERSKCVGRHRIFGTSKLTNKVKAK